MTRYNYDNKIGMYADDNGEWCRVDGWISVYDRLPNETQDEWCETYICYLKKENGEDFVTPLMSNGKLFLDESTHLDLTKYVTHWQPLPKAPNK